jgi:hypothetical protein
MLQHVQKVDAVPIVSENSLLFVATGGDVIDSTCVFYAKGARHPTTLAQKRENVKTKDLTLRLLPCLRRSGFAQAGQRLPAGRQGERGG